MNPYNDGRALLGFHDQDLRRLATNYFEERGYRVTAVKTPEQMIQYLMSEDAYWVMMNLDLGNPEGGGHGPAAKVISPISNRVKSSLVKFLGLSIAPGAVEKAKERGIPAMNTGSFFVEKDEIVERVE